MTGRGALESDAASAAAALDVVELFRVGWEALDADQILETLAQRDDTVMYGTDLVEHWVGYDELVDPTRSMVQAFANASYAWGEGEPRVWARGDVAWVCGNLHVRLEADGVPVAVTMRSTFVVVRDGQAWQIAHAHFSVGQEAPVAAYG